ncbi:hypothetical protein [Thermus phage P23-77]|uniref:Uncharacterized protein n=1 Tax=Thermus virus P23-77 TaxID=1714272 RepID=C8CHJ8_9VIRU|nr:hypothetical protein P23-77_gp01 [Thermus phage P23-77]ACV05063.1 hypothetical protein [Thermus phage P23-77]
MTQTQTLRRYERALRIALQRAQVPTEEELKEEPNLLGAWEATLEAYEEERPDDPFVQAWRDVERIVNVLEAIEREMGIPHLRPVPTHRRGKWASRTSAPSLRIGGTGRPWPGWRPWGTTSACTGSSVPGTGRSGGWPRRSMRAGC